MRVCDLPLMRFFFRILGFIMYSQYLVSVSEFGHHEKETENQNAGCVWSEPYQSNTDGNVENKYQYASG